MSRSMLSLLAGLGQGYNQGRQQEFENDRKTRLDQIALDRAARDTKEFDQQQADRTELRDAAAPVQAGPDMAPTPDGSPVQRMLPDPSGDNRDAGEPGTAPALPAQRVGMQGMLSPQQASAMVAQSNSPDAVRARQLAVLQRQSPEKAAVLAAHDLSLKNTQLDMANKEFDSALNSAATKGWDALGEFMNNSSVSPSRGKWLPSADGKTMQAYREGPNGELVPTPAVFENSPKGQAEAAQFFARQIPMKDKLKHYMDERAADRQEKRDEATEKYQGRMATVAEKNADTNERYREDMGTAALNKPGKSVIDRMSESDKMTFADINKQRETIAAAITKAQAEGMWDDKAPGSQQLATRLTALNMRATALTAKYEKEGGSAPDPLGVRKPAAAAPAEPAGPAGSVREQMRISPAQQAARDSDQLAILQRELAAAKNEDDRAALLREISRLPGQAKAPKPATRMQTVTAAAPVAAPPAAALAPAPPAAPKERGFMRRMADLGTDYTTPEGKAALKARVAEAANGGPPLTETETLRAKQAGLV